MPNGRWSPFQRQQQWSCWGMNFGHCLGNQLPCSSFQIKTQTLLSSAKIQKLIPTFLIFKGNEWQMVSHHKKFHARWKYFAMDNKLEIGDACVFELLDYSTQILCNVAETVDEDALCCVGS
ncbi:hypothetical protein Pint_20876 [Pistacia integerrima]|uniref:Uncharacterized protein n=1 Tax=Pistacia integerrima TaxID=434235 RepID=A0ACC0XBV6_9ROSI|nr:hypothetical protein Pint_20876 [Pistacia integerrima]